ncbi:MAG TPA: alanine racemase [Firmicutes bacterium]|jgi:alanine racemase|nr:alanine racemase [Bacillota bacterium]
MVAVTALSLGRPTWAEIDLSRLVSNLNTFKQILPSGVRIMAVIKADAYGHGAYEVSRVALREGVSMLGVASLEEGLDLRRKGINSPILILGYTDPRQYYLVVENDLTTTIFHWEMASLLSDQAQAAGKRVPIHVKLDTGMNRLGLLEPTKIMAFLDKLSALPGIWVEGLFTHFATADELENDFLQEQMQKFNKIIRESKKRGMHIPLMHAANSAAAACFPQSHLDMVRIGIGMYGYYPSAAISREKFKLYPVLSLKSRIILLKKIYPGATISYGRTFTATKETLIAVVPIGYGDGYSRQLSNKGVMLVHGQEVPVVGHVCMDLTMLDVGSVPDAREGDEVVVYGKQGLGEIMVEKVAEQLGTISYELLCNISSRIPRIYTGSA